MTSLSIQQAIKENKRLILDGGLATELERRGCDLSMGKLWSARILHDKPELVKQLHLEYLESGADIITTASYQASLEGFMEEGYPMETAKNLLVRSVSLAQEAQSMFYSKLSNQQQHQRCWIAASCGPFGAYLADGSEYRGNYGVPREKLYGFHKSRLDWLMSATPDIIAFETIPDIEEVQVILELMKISYSTFPFWISVQCRNETQMACGASLEQTVPLLKECQQCIAIGINCVEPWLITSHINIIREELKQFSIPCNVIAYPNSGEVYDNTLKQWKRKDSFDIMDWVHCVYHCDADIIGGCCRTTPTHIRLLRDAMLQANKSLIQ
eukprot:jgi/Galph1/4217/GphlegSOOS_G2808.1